MEIPWGLLGYWEYHGNTVRCWEAMGCRGRPWGCWGATGCHGVGPGSPSRLPAPTMSGALTANEGQHGAGWERDWGTHLGHGKPGAGGVSWAWTWVQDQFPEASTQQGLGAWKEPSTPPRKKTVMPQGSRTASTRTRGLPTSKTFCTNIPILN